jgi:sec-independent protein translocase protein TatB
MFPEGRALEFLIVAIVALIVVGPKDLPVLLRKLGQFMAKLRGMAAEFRSSFDEMARQSELDELRKEVEAMRSGQLLGGVQAPLAEAAKEIKHGLSADAAYPYPPAVASTEAAIVPVEPAPPKPRAKRATTVRKTTAPGTPARPRARRKTTRKTTEPGT